jgi:HPt (histidine-containing phosphotransfer) domain-containing protein
VSDALAGLRQRFVARCVGDLARLRDLARGDLASSELQDLAHSLAGAAGTFGFPHVSDVAGGVDDRFALGQSPSRAEVEALINALQDVVEAA